MTVDQIDKWRVIPSAAKETMWNAQDGWAIRRIDWAPQGKASQSPRGSILFLPGRGDHYEKYLETLDYWAELGWHVTAIDWRGQGLSGRLLDDPNVGYIDDFATWIADLRYFYACWSQEQTGPHVVVAHSMGGHLAMRALVEGAISPDATVLSAPMLGIQTGGLPLSVTLAYARLMGLIGRGKKAAWKISEKPLSAIHLRQKLLTHDARRYVDELSWWKTRPGVKLGPPSWHWMERSVASIMAVELEGGIESVTSPVLLMGTTGDQLVKTSWIVRDSKRLPKGELLLFGREAAHELLREADPVRDKCLSTIAEFLDRHAPAA